MKKGKINLFGLLLSSLFDNFFRFLYFFVNFFVLIGETAKKIIANAGFFIILVIRRSIRLTSRVKKIAVPSVKIRLRVLEHLSIKFRYFFLGSALTLIVLFLYQSFGFVKSLPSPQNIGRVNYPLSTHIFDRNGKLLFEVYREQNRTPINIKELPSYVTQATIAVEDKDFYEHNGISFVGGILRALKDTAVEGKLQGGSTITQQLVKSALLTSERTIQRKIKEIILALWTERIFSKDQILQMYLNQVPYGGSSYGIEEAAKTYFAKHAKDLTLSEAALLAGLPQAPTLYSPFVNPSLANSRRNEVLRLMKELQFISRDQMVKAQREELNIIPLQTKISAPHFVFYVKSYLENLYGIKQVEEGGFKVTTTVDLDIQQEAEKILKEEIEKINHLNVSNGAILVSRPSTGEIIAMVGSVDYYAQPYGAFNVTTAERQPGSSIKPIMYSLALEKGYTAASIIDDSPVTFQLPGGFTYKPVNYDERFHGRVTLRLALANSFNVPAVKVLSTLGVDNFIRQGQKMGITTWNDPSRFGLALTLGGGEVKMVDMATAYGVLANRGYRVNLSPLVKVESVSGGLFYESNVTKSKILNEGIAFILSEILADNFSRQLAFGSRSSLEIPGHKVSVKTGTTDEKKDNLAIGYTPEFLVAVWVGNNDNQPMNPYLTSGVTGATPIWNRMTSYLLNNYGSSGTWYSKPENVGEKICYFGRVEYFLKGTENAASCKDSLLKPTKKKEED
ncbi:penicillin-binding protein [Candidatus Roizmanbacteria bacterium]|nr:penicillin-binding protein [Candidatus Roizmanbacteria bacterium]